jgi:hypothetical protein
MKAQLKGARHWVNFKCKNALGNTAKFPITGSVGGPGGRCFALDPKVDKMYRPKRLARVPRGKLTVHKVLRGSKGAQRVTLADAEDMPLNVQRLWHCQRVVIYKRSNVLSVEM